MKLSVGIITYNEEERLGRTLNSVKDIADEIIIVDSYSTDATEDIALKYNCKFIKQKWLGYGLQKNVAINNCSGEWILLIDADEVISEGLKKSIIKNIHNNDDKNVFEIYFTTVCFGKKIKYGGWSGSYRIRLFKNGSGKYNNNHVHEEFITEQKRYRLHEEILHYSYESIEDYLNKFNRYTSEGAKEYFKRKKNVNIFSLLINSVFKFIRMYFIRFGFLDGYEGLLLSILSANYTYVKYSKLRELYIKGDPDEQKHNNI